MHATCGYPRPSVISPTVQAFLRPIFPDLLRPQHPDCPQDPPISIALTLIREQADFAPSPSAALPPDRRATDSQEDG